LQIWQRSPALTVQIYQSTETFPEGEGFSLTNQMRRAAVSVPANIAEGCGRVGDAEVKRFLAIAMGSACELDYYLLLSLELDDLDERASRQLGQELLEIRRMLATFIRKLGA